MKKTFLIFVLCGFNLLSAMEQPSPNEKKEEEKGAEIPSLLLLAAKAASGNYQSMYNNEPDKLAFIEDHLVLPNNATMPLIGKNLLNRPYQVNTLKPHSDEINALSLHPSKPLVASGGDDGKLIISDLVTGTIVDTYSLQKDRVLSVAYNPQGDKILITTDQFTGVYDTIRKRCERLNCRSLIRSAQFNLDGSLIRAGMENGSTGVWDSITGVAQATSYLQAHCDDHVIFQIKLHPAGCGFATTSSDYTAKLWKNNGQLMRKLDHEDLVRVIEPSPDGTFWMTGADNGEVKVWDAVDGSLMNKSNTKPHSNWIRNIAMNKLGTVAAVASDDKTITVWNRAKLIHKLKGHKSGVICVSVNSQGDLIVSGEENGKVALWNSKSGEMLGLFSAHKGKKVMDISFANNDKEIVSAGADGALHQWKLMDENFIQNLTPKQGLLVHHLFCQTKPLKLPAGSKQAFEGLADELKQTLIDQKKVCDAVNNDSGLLSWFKSKK
jgi:WD40 repeat protein